MGNPMGKPMGKPVGFDEGSWQGVNGASTQNASEFFSLSSFGLQGETIPPLLPLLLRPVDVTLCVCEALFDKNIRYPRMYSGPQKS